MASLTANDDGFGGKVVPPVTPETGVEYNWQGYAVIKYRDINGPVSGLIKMPFSILMPLISMPMVLLKQAKTTHLEGVEKLTVLLSFTLKMVNS